MPTQLERLIAYAEGDAYCPCCEGTTECDPNCTYRQDTANYPEQWERMTAARDALRPDPCP